MSDLPAQLANATKVIDQWLNYKVYAERIPGLSIGIIHADEVIFSKGYGYADLERQTPATAETGYRIASFSKVFTATAILQLFEQGKLQLDAPVLHYLPWFQSEHDSRTALITTRQLLTHTAGLDRDGATPHWIDYHFPSQAQIRQHIAAGGMTYTPAETWKYSNLGYTILGELVATVSGLSYEAYVQKWIIEPLALLHTSPTLTPEIRAGLALGYSRALPEEPQRTPFPQIETHAMASATGFSSTVLDLCRFMRAHLDGRTELLSEPTKREMRRIQWLREGFESDWTLGFQTWKINGQRYYGHGGSFQGFKSRFGFDPQHEIGVVILANGVDALSTELANSALQIIDHLLKNAADFEHPEQASLDLQPYEGTYRCIWDDFSVVAVSNDLLLYSAGSACPTDNYYQLRFAGEHQFTLLKGDSIGSIGELARFELAEEGHARRLFIGPDPAEYLEFV